MSQPHRPITPRLVLTLAPALLLAGCEKADNEPGPGGVTMGEARALDRAAEMIEAQSPPEPGPVATQTAPH